VCGARGRWWGRHLTTDESEPESKSKREHLGEGGEEEGGRIEVGEVALDGCAVGIGAEGGGDDWAELSVAVPQHEWAALSSRRGGEGRGGEGRRGWVRSV
jgi:hypothetical protein